MTTPTRIRTVVGALCAITAATVNAQAPIPYACAIFLAGLNDGPTQWAGAAYSHNQALDLGANPYSLASLSTAASIDIQKAQLLAPLPQAIE